LTTVIAYADKKTNKVWMGCDSATTGEHQTIITESKVFKKGKLLIGVSGCLRSADILEHRMKLPAKRKLTSDKYIRTAIVDAIRESLCSYGAMSINDGEHESPLCLLLGYDGRLYKMYSNFSINESIIGYNATGSGGPFALGALYNSHFLNIEADLIKALEAGEEFDQGSRGPFHIFIV